MIYINYIIKSKKTVPRRSYNLIKKAKKLKNNILIFSPIFFIYEAFVLDYIYTNFKIPHTHQLHTSLSVHIQTIHVITSLFFSLVSLALSRCPKNIRTTFYYHFYISRVYFSLLFSFCWWNWR